MSNSPILFSIGITATQNGRTLKSMSPDSNGVYKGVPLGLIGQASRNNVLYDTETVLDCITNPTKNFYKRLNEGNLKGEYQHPIIASEKDMHLITRIDQTLVSHGFKNIYAKKTEGGEYTVIYGDVKPMGPYGPQLIESFEDEDFNTCFSLRSLTTRPTPGPNGVNLKKMISLITFDCVDMPGYEMASKRYCDQGIESISEYALSIKDVMDNKELMCSMGVESDKGIEELYDILNTDSVQVHNMKNLLIDNQKSTLVTPSGQSLDPFHVMFNK